MLQKMNVGEKQITCLLFEARQLNSRFDMFCWRTIEHKSFAKSVFFRPKVGDPFATETANNKVTTHNHLLAG